jgi:single-strand DNA-binding protein
VTCWNKTAELVHKYLKKGRQVYIEGRLQYDTWTDESTGKNRKKAKIVADSVQFLGNKNDEVTGGFSNKNKTTDNTSGPIPF